MLKRKAITVLMIGVFALGACGPKEVSALSAALSELTGKVDMKEAGSEAFAPASIDSTLDVNGQIHTGDDGRVRLDLSSGTIIRVAPSSMFTLTSNDEVEGGLATKIKLELGKIFIILNGGTAEVETPSGVASVRGSYMSVWVDPETQDVHVTCLEGDCTGSNPAGGESFSEGESIILFHQNEDGTWTVPEVGIMTDDQLQDWLDENPEAQDLFNQANATKTAMAAVPTATSQPTATSEPTAEPTSEGSVPSGGSSSACLNVIEPNAGSELPFQGLVNFEWESRSGAEKYVVTFTNTEGNIVSFETTETSMEKYIEILPAGGQYSWQVAAIGEGGGQICTTDPISFSKPDSSWEPDPPAPKDPPEPPAPEEPECEEMCEYSCCEGQ